ncbi:MAG: DUF3341 domain-containing protein [Armatimonadota bacterium]|nr:DUF3341 domain-containing protein [Armatimonadota bacterium]
MEHTRVKSLLYGLVAEFDNPEDLIAAARQARDAGYKRMDAYAPFPVHGLSNALGFRDNSIPFTMLLGGISGCVFGFLFITYCVVYAYPLNIGGKPLFGWPSFIPPTFEMTILFAALSGVFGMIIYNGLPMPYHSIFNAPGFERATSDRFFLCIEERDSLFDRVETERFLRNLIPQPLRVSEVES